MATAKDCPSAADLEQFLLGRLGWVCMTGTATSRDGVTMATRLGQSEAAGRNDHSGWGRAAHSYAVPPSNRNNWVGLRVARVPVGR
jgi:hypothetical protein